MPNSGTLSGDFRHIWKRRLCDDCAFVLLFTENTDNFNQLPFCFQSVIRSSADPSPEPAPAPLPAPAPEPRYRPDLLATILAAVLGFVASVVLGLLSGGCIRGNGSCQG